MDWVLHPWIRSDDSPSFFAGAWYPRTCEGTVSVSRDLIFRIWGGRNRENLFIYSAVVPSLSLVQLFQVLWTAAHRLPCPSLSPGVCSNSYPLTVIIKSNHHVTFGCGAMLATAMKGLSNESVSAAFTLVPTWWTTVFMSWQKWKHFPLNQICGWNKR